MTGMTGIAQQFNMVFCSFTKLLLIFQRIQYKIINYVIKKVFYFRCAITDFVSR